MFKFGKRNILNRQEWKIMSDAEKRGREMTQQKALAIAKAQQRKNGRIVEDNLYLTKEGEQYSYMSSEQRAIYRRAKSSGRPPYHYEYVLGKVRIKPEYKKMK